MVLFWRAEPNTSGQGHPAGAARGIGGWVVTRLRLTIERRPEACGLCGCWYRWLATYPDETHMWLGCVRQRPIALTVREAMREAA